MSKIPLTTSLNSSNLGVKELISVPIITLLTFLTLPACKTRYNNFIIMA